MRAGATSEVSLHGSHSQNGPTAEGTFRLWRGTLGARVRSAALCLAALLTACAGTGPIIPDGELVLALVVPGLSQPLGVEHAGDGSGRLFVVQKGGLVRIVQGGALLPDPYLNLSAHIYGGTPPGETGLLGLAFHPDFANNGRLFVHYTNTSGDGIIAELETDDPAANQLSLDSLAEVLAVTQFGRFHQGGQIAFGPDGYLYVALGDGGSSGTAQDLGDLHGKVLRLDIDGAAPYQVPADNPFVGNPDALDEIWVYGLRNPWRFSFDSMTDDLWIADVGQDTVEEVTRLPAGVGGQNLGWPITEGDRCYLPPAGCNTAGLTMPDLTYAHGAETGGSVAGGFVYRGAISELVGDYVFGDFSSGRVFLAEEVAGAWTMSTLFPGDGRNVSSFGVDEQGELLVVDYDGALYRIAAEE